MKKISSVILCLILCLNIVGCSSNPAANTSSQISSQENEESNTARSLHFSLEKQGVDINIWREDEKLYVKNDGYYVVKYEDRDNYKVADDWDTYFLSNVYEDVKLVNKDAQNSEIKVFTWEQNVKETKEITGVDLE